MRKTIITVFILMFVASASFTEELSRSEYERKLEYKRKKIEVVIQSHMVGRKSGYMDVDTTEFRYTTTTEGYSYGNSSTTGSRGETISFEKVSDWMIVKGGIRELSDLEFLEITDNTEKAEWVRMRVDDKRFWSNWGTGTFLVGLLTVIAGATVNPTNTSLISAGSLMTVGGFLINALLGSNPRHYIHPDFAQEEADRYNIRIKRSLSIPIEYE